jgi:hypothetical protein
MHDCLSNLGTNAGSRQPVQSAMPARHVIERLAINLCDQDQARLAYLDHLRSQHRRSPRAEADSELAKARAAPSGFGCDRPS